MALRQLVRNAAMHRSYEGTNSPIHVYWYDDRIEINSPGGAYGEVSAENFGQPGFVAYRNPLVAEAMRVLNLLQRWGSGLPIARRELRANQLSPRGSLGPRRKPRSPARPRGYERAGKSPRQLIR